MTINMWYPGQQKWPLNEDHCTCKLGFNFCKHHLVAMAGGSVEIIIYSTNIFNNLDKVKKQEISISIFKSASIYIISLFY